MDLGLISAIAGPLLSSFMSGDAPSAPTAEQMKTDLQRQMDPLLLSLSKAMGLNYDEMKSAITDYTNTEIDKRTNYTPEDYVKAKYNNQGVPYDSLAVTNAANTPGAKLPNADQALKIVADTPKSKEFFQLISKYGNDWKDYADKGIGKDAKNPINNGADYIKMRLEKDNLYTPENQQMLQWAKDNYMADPLTYNMLKTSQKMEAMKQNLISQGYDINDVEKEFTTQFKPDEKTGTVSYPEGANFKYSKTIDKEGVQTTPYPQVKAPEEEKLVKEQLTKLMNENPAIKTIDEAVAILKQAADPTKQKEYMAALEKTATELKNNPYVKKIEEAGGPSAGQQAVRQVVMKRMSDAVSNNGADYRANLYKAASDPLIARTEEATAKNAADIATRMGNSQTIVNSTNAGLNRDLDRNLGVIGARSAADAESLITDIITNAMNNETGLANQQLQATTAAGTLQQQGTDQSAQAFNNLTNLANNTATTQANIANDIAGAGVAGQTAQMSVLDALNNMAKTNTDRQLTNMNLKTAYETDQRNQLQNIFNNILSLYSSQSGPQQIQANALSDAFKAETAAAKDKQSLVSGTLSGALNYFNSKGNSTGTASTTYQPSTYTVPTYTLPTPSVVSTYNNSKNYSMSKNIPS